MKGLAKIIGIILGILGLSSKATSVKKSKIKKIDNLFIIIPLLLAKYLLKDIQIIFQIIF